MHVKNLQDKGGSRGNLASSPVEKHVRSLWMDILCISLLVTVAVVADENVSSGLFFDVALIEEYSRSNSQDGLLAHAHLHNTLIPA